MDSRADIIKKAVAGTALLSTGLPPVAAMAAQTPPAIVAPAFVREQSRGGVQVAFNNDDCTTASSGHFNPNYQVAYLKEVISGLNQSQEEIAREIRSQRESGVDPQHLTSGAIAGALNQLGQGWGSWGANNIGQGAARGASDQAYQDAQRGQNDANMKSQEIYQVQQAFTNNAIAIMNAQTQHTLNAQNNVNAMQQDALNTQRTLMADYENANAVREKNGLPPLDERLRPTPEKLGFQAACMIDGDMNGLGVPSGPPPRGYRSQGGDEGYDGPTGGENDRMADNASPQDRGGNFDGPSPGAAPLRRFNLPQRVVNEYASIYNKLLRQHSDPDDANYLIGSVGCQALGHEPPDGARLPESRASEGDIAYYVQQLADKMNKGQPFTEAASSIGPRGRSALGIDSRRIANENASGYSR